MYYYVLGEVDREETSSARFHLLGTPPLEGRGKSIAFGGGFGINFERWLSNIVQEVTVPILV